jgi:hypothetical protein
MNTIAEPFLSAEIEYRQRRVAEQYTPHSRPRHWVRRRPGLKLPHPRRRPVAVACPPPRTGRRRKMPFGCRWSAQ